MIDMHRTIAKTRGLAGLSVVAALLGGALPSLASTVHPSKHRSHRKAKRHARPRHVAAPKGGLALRGLATVIVPLVGVGDISPPSPLLPAQILQRFGQPGPTADRLETIGRLDGAIVSIDYFPYDSRAGVSFRFDGPPVNSLDGIAIGSPAYYTPQGLHVGSTSGQVQAALPQALCDPSACTLFANAAGGTVNVTAFDLLDGKVAQISITGERSSDPY